MTEVWTNGPASSTVRASLAARAQFQTGGSMALEKPVRLAVDDHTGTCSSIELPASSAAVNQFCASCSVSALRNKHAEVHDVHRQGTSTLLSSKQIFTSFHPASTSMLADIGRLMGFCNVSAKLNSLQLLGQGHEVSPHMTMPNPNGQFGSLIVCLPGQHAGGDIIIKHSDIAAKTEWGQRSCLPVIQWLAFYSNTLYEVRPIRSGTRIALCYGLYASPLHKPSASLSPGSLPFQKALAQALCNPNFFIQGRALGFATQMAYPHTSKTFSKHGLKGPDAAIVAAAEGLGLRVAIVPVWKVDESDLTHYFDCCNEIRESGMEPLSPRDKFLTGQPWALKFKDMGYTSDDSTMTEFLEEAAGCYDAGQSQAVLDETRNPSEDRQSIMWCNADFMFGEVGLTWVRDDCISGANANCEESAAAIVIRIPSDKEC